MHPFQAFLSKKMKKVHRVALIFSTKFHGFLLAKDSLIMSSHASHPIGLPGHGGGGLARLCSFRIWECFESGKILGECDEGILKGRVGWKIFVPHISLDRGLYTVRHRPWQASRLGKKAEKETIEWCVAAHVLRRAERAAAETAAAWKCA